MNRAGFNCVPNYDLSFKGHICERGVTGPWGSGCIERVEIIYDVTGRRVDRIVVPLPPCAGL